MSLFLPWSLAGATLQEAAAYLGVAQGENFFLILFDPLLAAIKSIEVAQMLEEKTWKRDEKLVEQGE